MICIRWRSTCFLTCKDIDALEEIEKGGSSIGTTKKGIGPTYAAKVCRNPVAYARLRALASVCVISLAIGLFLSAASRLSLQTIKNGLRATPV